MDHTTTLTALFGGGGGLGLFAFLRWAVNLWAAIRREELEAAKQNSARQATESSRMVDALMAQAKSNAELGGAITQSNTLLVGKIELLNTKLDTIYEWRERTPVEGVPTPIGNHRDTPSESRRRTQSEQRGYRPPGKPPQQDEP